MKNTPLWVRALLFCGIPPHKALLCLFDLLALTGTALLIFLARAAFGGMEPELYHWALPLLLLGPLLGMGLGLYQTISLPPHRELKAQFQMVSLLYGIILAVLFLSQTGDAYSRIVVAGSWAATLFTLPCMRALCRRLFVRRRWWGKDLVIFDRSDAGRELWHYLKRCPERGLNPVDIVALPGDAAGARACFADAARRRPGAVALLLQKAEQGQAADYITEAGRYFDSVLLVPFFSEGFRTHWLTPRDLGNAVGLLVRQNLHDKRRLRFKRATDILLCAVGAAVLLPLGLLLALAIRLDSPGPVFYRQRRIGRDGREVRIFKFRTMVADADAVLRRLLADDPALREEWARDQKLRHDPRITRVGRFLRKVSLDELPQLINVVTGDMSLVGPRPIVASEIPKYGPVYEEYCMVRPGITGLWQISGRNNTTYGERVAYDHYYINNWSVWMDLWILAKTVPVVITGYGAY
ncbi:MAG: undecaprenyl-phosphate galactose phosphotransferase WbaP [Desulfovibrio desulfuricans]|jgi:Undecaprenyl-phosphate galactose phosphotransferase WbaP|nr:undecaprenyl-phosphate galactose phosphotransferase WbaP [Desulfovibrio desulfuricans]